MTTLEQRIINDARRLGACELINTARNMKELCELMFMPQGREFCLKHNFPSLATIRECRTMHLREYGIFCDTGRFKSGGGTSYYLVGKTAAELKFTKNNMHLVILAYGASAIIKASNYAVVRVERQEGCMVELINEDGTAKFLE